jgi:hypothetical protein
MTKTFSAGGNEAISTVVAAHSGVNGPDQIISAKTISGWMISFTAIPPGTSQGTRPNGRSATVTPSTNSATGAAALRRNASMPSSAT